MFRLARYRRGYLLSYSDAAFDSLEDRKCAGLLYSRISFDTQKPGRNSPLKRMKINQGGTGSPSGRSSAVSLRRRLLQLWYS
jgi:hypothetical protein